MWLRVKYSSVRCTLVLTKQYLVGWGRLSHLVVVEWGELGFRLVISLFCLLVLSLRASVAEVSNCMLFTIWSLLMWSGKVGLPGWLGPPLVLANAQECLCLSWILLLVLLWVWSSTLRYKIIVSRPTDFHGAILWVGPPPPLYSPPWLLGTHWSDPCHIGITRALES